jgi:hypothetical protein
MGSTIQYPSLGTLNSELEQAHSIVIRGPPEIIWVPSTKEEKPSTASSSTDIPPTRDVAPLSEEAKKMWEHNQPRIEALSTATTKDKEVVKLFREYQKECDLPGHRIYFRDTKSIHRRGCWTAKGIIASARMISLPIALDVLGRPTIVSPEF